MKPARTLRILLALLGACVLSGCGKRQVAGRDAPSPAVRATNQAASVTTVEARFAKLRGRWQRPDGGYIIDIQRVDADGKLAASYFNPRSIHVAKAQASQDGEAVKVFIELRDANYPGATYRLTYHPQRDQLAGLYHQPLLGQTFEVVFLRLKP